MVDLIELIQLLHLGKLRTSSVWSSIMEPGSLMEQLYDAILEGKVKTDEDAMSLLYGAKGESTAFQSLKSRLKDRLIDAVFLIDYRDAGFSDRQKAYFECNKRWAASMVLLSKNIKLTAVDILERLLKQTMHFEFTEVTMNILYNLRLHYGTIDGDQKKYEQSRTLYTEYQQIWMMENEAEELYTRFVNQYMNSRAAREELTGEAEEFYERIRPNLEKCDSFRLHLCGRLLELMVHSSRNDYVKSADACRSAIEFFEKKPYNSSLPMQAFYYQLVVCHVQLKEFEKGADIIQRYQNIYEDGSFNWFKLQELFFLLAMHTGHYQEAFDVYEKVAQHNKLSTQPVGIQETWKIMEAYAHFLVHSGKVEREPATRFRLNKFLNEIPKFSQDKRGMNIPVLVAQILFMFADKQYAQTIDRIEALDRYCSRYLKKNDTFRSNCFIKMLMAIPEAGFHREAVVRKAQKFRDLLDSMPMELSNQAHGIEIIPYEALWEMALEMLDTQIIIPRKK